MSSIIEKARGITASKDTFVVTRDTVANLAAALLEAALALEHIRDSWKHAPDCDVSFGQSEDYCDCYRGVAAGALRELGE